MKKIKRGWAFVIAIVLFLVFDFIRFLVKEPNVPKVENLIPPPDPGRAVRTYDFKNEKWIYEDESEPRAKGEMGPEKYLTEEELQEYLEEHVDGYLEDTYWGDEFDLDDDDDDDY